nr:hypothetical protein [Mycobacterium paraintracellulare]
MMQHHVAQIPVRLIQGASNIGQWQADLTQQADPVEPTNVVIVIDSVPSLRRDGRSSAIWS